MFTDPVSGDDIDGRARGIALVLAFAFSIGLTFNGFNDAFGNPLVCIIGAGSLMGSILLDPPETAFWRRIAPVLSLGAAAIAWASAPVWAPATTTAGAAMLAPDLVASETLAAAGYMAALVCGCLVARRRGAVGTAIDGVLLFGCLNLAGALAIRALGDAAPWDLWLSRPDGRFTGTLSNANVAGAYYAMVAVLAVSRASALTWARGQALLSPRRIAYGLAILLAVGACALTASRSAMTSVVVALGTLATLPHLRARAGRRIVGLSLIAAGVIGLLVLVGVADLLSERLELLSREPSVRSLMWSHYAELALRQPLFGYGPGSFSALNQQMLGDPRQAQAIWTVNSPHNLLLQLALDGGLPYLALILAAALWFGCGVVRSLRASGVGEGRAGIVAALLIATGCAMVDIALDVPAMTALAFFLAGLLYRPVPEAARSASSERTSRQRRMKGS